MAQIARTQDKTLQEFLLYLRRFNLVRPGEKVLVAVSGGIDSTVLAHLFSRAADILDVDVELAHVDHRTRGLSSRQEALWVGVMGERLGLPTHSLEVGKSSLQGQASLRSERRRLLLELAEECGAQVIATAHHADDNAETFLMRAISGSGVQGLAAIAPRNGTWIRPLLWATRDQIFAYAREHSLAWVDDPSNHRSEYLRNQLRNEFLPALETIREGSIRNLARAASRVFEEETELDAWLEQQISGPVDSLPLGWLEKWPRPLKRRALKIWLRRLGIEGQPALIEALLKGEDLYGPLGSFLRQSDLLIFRAEDEFGSEWVEPKSVSIGRRIQLGASSAWSFLSTSSVQAQGSLYDFGFALSFRSPEYKAPHSIRLAWDRLPAQLVVRSRQSSDPVDRIESVLRDKGIPRALWKSWPLLATPSQYSQGNQVVAVLGLKVFDEFLLQGLERCVCLESFFEERLRPLSESC